MIIFFLLTIFSLIVYSYSQIDLNLTLLQAPLFLRFQNTMIDLGYFQRPLSTSIFVLITIALFLIYWLFYKRAVASKIRKVEIATIFSCLLVLGLISYPAFSHDFFNAIFYPRIIIEHHANPYLVTALMFPDDTWTRFMQWTHNTYQWGPVYLLISMPFYLLGFGKFILTFLSFKLMSTFGFLSSAYLIHKLAGKTGAIIFGLNPLIIYEALVAGHLDIIMLVFALVSIYFLTKKSRFLALGAMIVSAGIKFVTVLFLPLLFLGNRFSEKIIWKLFLITSILGAIAQIYFRDFLPHYFIVPLGIFALQKTSSKRFLFAALFCFVFLMFRYVPFISAGQWWSVRLF